MKELRNTAGMEEYIKNAEMHEGVGVELMEARLTTDEDFLTYVIEEYLSLRKGGFEAVVPEFNHDSDTTLEALKISPEKAEEFAKMVINIDEERIVSKGIEKVCRAALKDPDMLKMTVLAALSLEALMHHIRQIKSAAIIIEGLMEMNKISGESNKDLDEVVQILLKHIKEIPTSGM